jgi:hypothetical protein
MESSRAATHWNRERRTRARLVATTAGLCLAGAVALADMPAVNQYWVRTDAVVEASRVFPEREVAAFQAALKQAVVAERQPPKELGPSFVSVSEYGLLDAVVALVQPHLGKGEIENAKAFLAAVSEGKWVRGRLVARNGGDFVTSLALVAEADSRIVLRQVNRAVTPGEWKATTFDRLLR